MRVSQLTVVFFLTVAGLLAQPAFEVASVKATLSPRNAEGYSHTSIDVPGPGRFRASNANLANLIRWAYEARDYQVSGPSWLSSEESYDIEGKTAPGTSVAQIRLMVQSLLAERFQLRLRREERMLPIYALVKGKDGSKLREGNPNGRQSMSSERGKMTSQNTTMAMLANQLTRVTGRTVVDRTGLSGAYDFSLSYAPEDDTTGQRPSLYTALPEQLGLKLEATKGPVEVLVIDHAERPSAN